MKENITEEQRQMIIKYRNDYINAIEEMIKSLNPCCSGYYALSVKRMVRGYQEIKIILWNKLNIL